MWAPAPSTVAIKGNSVKLHPSLPISVLCEASTPHAQSWLVKNQPTRTSGSASGPWRMARGVTWLPSESPIGSTSQATSITSRLKMPRLATCIHVWCMLSSSSSSSLEDAGWRRTPCLEYGGRGQTVPEQSQFPINPKKAAV